MITYKFIVHSFGHIVSCIGNKFYSWGYGMVISIESKIPLWISFLIFLPLSTYKTQSYFPTSL